MNPCAITCALLVACGNDPPYRSPPASPVKPAPVEVKPAEPKVLARIDDGAVDAIRVAGDILVFTQRFDLDPGKNRVLMVPLAGGSVVQLADGRGNFDFTLAVVKGTVIWKEIRQDKRGTVELFSVPVSGGSVTRRASMYSLLFTTDADQVYFGDGPRLMAMGPTGAPRILATDKNAADIERGLMLTSAGDRLFFWVVPSTTTVYRTDSNKPAAGRMVSVAKTGGALRDEIVPPEGTRIVGITADESALYWIETEGGDSRLRTRLIAGGEPKQLATFASTVTFLELETRDGELVWKSMGVEGGPSSLMRWTPKRQETVFERPQTMTVAPTGIIVARATGTYGKGAELLLLPR